MVSRWRAISEGVEQTGAALRAAAEEREQSVSETETRCHGQCYRGICVDPAALSAPALLVSVTELKDWTTHGGQLERQRCYMHLQPWPVMNM